MNWNFGACLVYYMQMTFLSNKIKYLWICVILNILVVDLYFCFNVLPQKEQYTPDYHFYHNLSQIEKELVKIVDRNSNYMKIDWEYQSREKRPQLLLHISNFTGRNPNQISSSHGDIPRLRVLFSYGEHAREFLPIESMFYLLHNLTEGLSRPLGTYPENFSRKILSKMDIYIIALANPDGRSHIERTKNYCWRGTSTGVDLDRNFDWEFGNKGSSSDPKDEEYRGARVFSEPECLVFTELTGRISFDAFISFHSGIQHIYIPYSDTVSQKTGRKPDNIDEMMHLAAVLSKSTSSRILYGHAYQFNGYTADGTVFDYMAGVRGIPFSYTVELWGKEHKGPSCFDLFNPENEDLQDTVKSLHPFYVKLFDFLIEWKAQSVQHMSDPVQEAPSLFFGYSLLLIVIVITIIMAVHGKFPFCTRIYQRRRIVSLRSLSSTFVLLGNKS